jgi:hypothetical protein
MAPSILQPSVVPPHQLHNPSKGIVDRKIFPDGIKTSGQHPPIASALRPYSDFPKEISGRSVWKAEDYQNNPERWVHVLSKEEIEELSNVADNFLASKTPLTGISQVTGYLVVFIPKEYVLTLPRIISIYPNFLSYLAQYAMKFSMEKASYSSKASQSRNGEITSPLLRTWGSERIWDTSSVRIVGDTFLVMSKTSAMMRPKLTKSGYTGQTLGMYPE